MKSKNGNQAQSSAGVKNVMQVTDVQVLEVVLLDMARELDQIDSQCTSLSAQFNSLDHLRISMRNQMKNLQTVIDAYRPKQEQANQMPVGMPVQPE